MKKLVKLLSVVLSVVMVFGMLGTVLPAYTAAASSNGFSTATSYLSFGESIIVAVRNFLVNLKYMFERLTGKEIVVDASSAYDLSLANNGEAIKVSSDFSADDIVISNAVNLNLNGHTVSCKSFTLKTDKTGDYTISNGTLKAQGGGDIKIIAPNASIQLDNLKLTLASPENQFYVDAALNTLHINANVNVMYLNNETIGTIHIDDNTRVVVSAEVLKPINIAVLGDNVTVENYSQTLIEDGQENAGCSIVSVEVENNDVKNLTITNKTTIPESPQINVTVPENYTAYVQAEDHSDNSETNISVTTTGGTSVDNVTNGKLPEVTYVMAAFRAGSDPNLETPEPVAIIGLKASVLYEYRPCWSTEYTAVEAGATSFITNEKHIFIRAKAFGKYTASDELEIFTGMEDPIDTLYIGCIDELKDFRDSVNSGTNYTKTKVYLTGDIDLNNEPWTPIGKNVAFKGTFDGQGHTISNLKVEGTLVNSAQNNSQGFFGNANNSTIKNLNVNNANVSGSLYVGVIVGKAMVSNFDNCNVTGRVIVNAWWYASAFLGNGYAVISNSNVIADDESKVEITGGYAAGIIGFSGEGSAERLKNCSSNIDVYGQYNGIGGLIGILHYGNKVIDCTCTGNVYNTTTEEGEEKPTGGICGSYMSTATQKATITNSTFTGTIYHLDDEHPNMAHPLYGASYDGTSVIVIDGVTIAP